ncbi:hypothetical protein FI070_420006 [Flavobacterium psychrophilum]|nr:hypothetical protein FI070_420006 [Flavobacterium psychrophilum]
MRRERKNRVKIEKIKSKVNFKMDNRDYDEALCRILESPIQELDKYIKLEYDKSDEKPVFYSKLLESGNSRLIQDCLNKPKHWEKAKLYAERKARGGIKLDSDPNDLEIVLKDALSVDKFNSPAVLRGYYLLANNKKGFYPGILKLFEEKKDITKNYVHKGDAIREFCKSQIAEHNFWKRNDYANSKWIGTSLFTFISIIVSFMSYQKKSEKLEPIIIEHNNSTEVEKNKKNAHYNNDSINKSSSTNSTVLKSKRPK